MGNPSKRINVRALDSTVEQCKAREKVAKLQLQISRTREPSNGNDTLGSAGGSSSGSSGRSAPVQHLGGLDLA